MLSNRASIALPVAMISLGTGALLTQTNVAPKIDWIWTLGLALAGGITLILAGIDRVTVVICGMCLVMCGLSVLRQLELLSVDVEIPLLVIACGVLMLCARHPRLRNPKWLE